MVFRKRVFDAVGMFNTSFKGFEDSELIQRITDCGKKIKFEPQLKVFHHTDGFKEYLQKQLGKSLWNWKYSIAGYGKSYKVHYLLIPIACLAFFFLIFDRFLFLGYLLMGLGALLVLSALAAVSITDARATNLKFVPGIFLALLIQIFFSTIRGIYAIFVRIFKILRKSQP